MELSEALFTLVHAVRNNMKYEIKQLALDLSPMHFKSLKAISRIDNCTGQKLTELMGRDKAQINRLIKELVSQELINKIENKVDKRSQILALSEKGLEVMNTFKKVEKKVFNKMTHDIPAEQLKAFVETTEKLKNNL
ncbi:MarR family winged helix-turn-helix transcriptional regulator [Psychromonas algarum]|uniref:MarR family winged helix-turn-helix transcriptional regulator n=1 Tax=Psychromonas algarum TaxID=2555643 RepID=UPI00141A40E3|nr:MarR family transcriptional regulator [Psychromonas sp. RZ22]